MTSAGAAGGVRPNFGFIVSSGRFMGSNIACIYFSSDLQIFLDFFLIFSLFSDFFDFSSSRPDLTPLLGYIVYFLFVTRCAILFSIFWYVESVAPGLGTRSYLR